MKVKIDSLSFGVDGLRARSSFDDAFAQYEEAIKRLESGNHPLSADSASKLLKQLKDAKASSDAMDLDAGNHNLAP
jgi:hypothetical protein